MEQRETFQNEFGSSNAKVFSYFDRLQFGKIYSDSSLCSSTIYLERVEFGGDAISDGNRFKIGVVQNGKRPAFRSAKAVIRDVDGFQVRIVRKVHLRHKGEGANSDFNLREFRILIDSKARELPIVH